MTERKRYFQGSHFEAHIKEAIRVEKQISEKISEIMEPWIEEEKAKLKDLKND